MKIAIAQLNPTVGALEANLKALEAAALQAVSEGAQLLLAPELVLSGCPPRDLLLNRAFVGAAIEALEDFLKNAIAPGLALYFGTPLPPAIAASLATDGSAVFTTDQSAVFATDWKTQLPSSGPIPLQNVGILAIRGKLLACTSKKRQVSYGGFDERRYFLAGDGPRLVDFQGKRLLIGFADDFWRDPTHEDSASLQTTGDSASVSAKTPPSSAQIANKESSSPPPDLVLALGASAFCMGKEKRRQEALAQNSARLRAPLVFCNLVGGNDGLIFDGNSLVLSAEGERIAKAPAFETSLEVVDLRLAKRSKNHPETSPQIPERAPPLWTPLDNEISDSELQQLHDALALGLRDYVHKSGFQQVLIPLSGGMDSALVAVLAVAALGASKVRTLFMPSFYTQSISATDAQALARALGVSHTILPINTVVDSHWNALHQALPEIKKGAVEENLQARTRGNLAMAAANASHSLLLACGNKSELATGYCTLYGDMAGAVAVIGDVPKTLVYALARHINRRHQAQSGSPLIPERIIERPPSAELSANQVDQDSLPPYDQLDRVLRRRVEGLQSEDEIAAAEADVPADVLRHLLRLIDLNEHKRRQAALILQVSSRSFGSGRDFPLVQSWRG